MKTAAEYIELEDKYGSINIDLNDGSYTVIEEEVVEEK